ncbi:hypothetical protein Rmet_4673 (plasmid) [Cupriavidus metallidurans CH34]|uniref:DUF2147 domain-containing protein n=1 Tax=Cupriavidus metallidurans (strain ATCC 43123 / DSM 2839 / NBRC 102507 / CH34) TaxID=266264 RepID=Q1LE91_CUPMC|nr:hypothetical protein Rmet_4673 [Cupriavidus metallidurans CH34]
MDRIRLLLLLTFTALHPLAWAAELSESDAGTYEWLKEDRTPMGVLYRFSRSGNKWVAFGKLPGKDWKAVSCDPGCEYRNSTAKEIQTYFPPSFREHNELACIQNMAQVFCRFTPVNEPRSRGYIFIVLVTGKPLPVRTRRLN